MLEPGGIAAPDSLRDDFRVLVVDDESAVRATLRRLLEMVGFDVREATDGNDAVALLATSDVDVVLTDIAMPGMDGIALLEAIRSRDADLPVVLLSGLPALETAIQAVELGAFRYLMKPFDARTLVATLEMAGKLYRVARLRRIAQFRAEEQPCVVPIEFDRNQALSEAMSSIGFAYQPVWEARTGALVGYEALMRPSEPAFPNPGVLLDAAERTGRVIELGRIVRARAPLTWKSEVRTGLLFVNLHPAELADPALLDPNSVLASVANRVVLEVTERHTLCDLKELDSTFRQLREMGFRLALDDLGAGYASLNSFAALCPSFVKLDMGLIRAIDTDPVRRRLVASMIQVCNDLDSQVVAEGIETPAEKDAVTELGAHLLQGFLLGRPQWLGPQPGAQSISTVVRQ